MNLAQRELGRSVVYINTRIKEELLNKNLDPMYFGIKDTNQIPDSIIEKLRSNTNFAWLTIDKASNRGRAIDTDLVNPVTYRAMTGSTSGGPINILKGINDFAIGTDGGGSVLAPALSCQLPSMIGAGLGILVKNKKKSTDGMEFTGSVGVISKNVQALRMVMECITDHNLSGDANRQMRIAIPKRGTVQCPDQKDMYEKVISYLSRLDENHFIIEEVDMTGIEDRKEGINVISKSLNGQADVIVTCEGPVDVYGYGETIPQYLGQAGMDITKNHGKYLVRAANMCQVTAITIPIESLASGIVIIAKKGIEPCKKALQLAEQLEKVIAMPEVWKRYFIEEPNFTGLELH